MPYAWRVATLREECGSCQTEIKADARMLEIEIANTTVRRVRCEPCGERFVEAASYVAPPPVEAEVGQ